MRFMTYGICALAALLPAAAVRAEGRTEPASHDAGLASPRLVALSNKVILLVTSPAGIAAQAANASADGKARGAAPYLPTAQPEVQAEPAALVTWGRADDLKGRPIDLTNPILRSARLRLPLSGLPAGALPSIMPVSAAAMTSGFGMREHPLLGVLRAHRGVDLAAPSGTPIVATSDGVVSLADWRGGYGLSIALEHGGGLETRYGHMSRLSVAAGQSVRKGQVIGFVGSTGLSTGPHLHYEVRVNGVAVNPALSKRR